MGISETILLIITTVITAISALFCVIGLATPQWLVPNTGLFCTGCSTPSAGLSIVAFILLIISVVILSLFICRILPASARLISLVALFLSGIFTLASFAAYFDAYAGYSYKLMVVSHFLCYTSSILAAFWLGTTYSAKITQAN